MSNGFQYHIPPLVGNRHYPSRQQMLRVMEKHVVFVNTPIDGKSVRHLPGIEETLSERLIERGYVYASQLMDKYLALNKRKNHFMYWMAEICGAGPREAADCFYALEAWIETNLLFEF